MGRCGVCPVVWLVGALLLLFGALTIDQPVYKMAEAAGLREADWNRMLRIAGYLPTWLLLALVFLLIDTRHYKTLGVRALFFRASFLGASVVVSGIVGEIGKLLIRRERPALHDGLSAFRPFTENFLSTTNLATPSTHAIVAFGAAWALTKLHPRGWPVYFFIAIGCGATRVLSAAHFVSDIVVAFGLAGVTVWLLGRLWRDPFPSTSETLHSQA